MRHEKKLIILTTALLALTSCGTSSGNETTLKVNEEETGRSDLKISENQLVTNYVQSQDFNPEDVLSFDLGTTVSPSCTFKEGGDASITITKKTVCSAESGTADINSVVQSEKLYPGEVLKADSNMVEGNPTELSNLERSKTSYTVNLPGLTDTGFSVPYTNRTNVTNALNAKINAWSLSGNTLTAKTSSNITKTCSTSQLDVTLGFGLGKSLGIDASYEQTQEQNIFIVSYEQIYYSVVTSFDNNDTTVFGNAVSPADVQRECTDESGKAIPPVIIDQANYGKMIYFEVKTSMTESELKTAFSYTGCVTVEDQNTFNESLKDSEVKCLIYGGAYGTEYSSLSPISGSNKGDQITKILQEETKVDGTSAQHAVMLSYSTSWLKNGSHAKVQSTTDYIDTTYETKTNQHITIKNSGAFEVNTWVVRGYPITGFTDDGQPIYGERVELEKRTHIPACQGSEYNISAKYGKIEFAYDISWGSDWPFDRRISTASDWFGEANIETCGTTYGSYVKLTVDGVYSKI